MLRARLSLSKQHVLLKTLGGTFLICLYTCNSDEKLGLFKTFSLDHQCFSIKVTPPFFFPAPQPSVYHFYRMQSCENSVD